MRTFTARHSGASVRLLTVAVVVVLLGWRGDAIVLSPGTIAGTTGVSGWTFGDGGYRDRSGANGYTDSATIYDGEFNVAANVPITGGSYAATVESGQTYPALSATVHTSVPNNASYLIFRTTDLVPTLNGTITEDLHRPGGVLRIAPEAVGTSVNTMFVAATADGYAQGETYYGEASGTAPAHGWIDVPMAATTNPIYVMGSVAFTITDAQANTCTVHRDFEQEVPSLSAGGLVTVSPSFSLGAESCAPGSIEGTVDLRSTAPAAFVSGSVYALAPPSRVEATSSFLSLPFQFVLPARPGSYQAIASATFAAPYESTLFMKPTATPSTTEVVPVQPTIRTFTHDAALVTGQIAVTGPLSALPYAASMSLFEDPMSVTPPREPNAARVPLAGPRTTPAAYGAVLTTGRWMGHTFDAKVYDAQSRLTNAVAVFDPATQPITLSFPGASRSDVNIAIDTSAGDVVFDVDEAPGQAAVPITDPSIVIATFDPATSRQLSAEARAYITSAAPVVHVVGPPGEHHFSAQATINGASTPLSGTIDLGLSQHTAVGSAVTVPLLNSGAARLGDVTFGGVTQAGYTTASGTDTGPASAGLRLVPAIRGRNGFYKYLSIVTTAVHAPVVHVRLEFDPVDLGLSPAQVSRLRLRQFTCAASCGWSDITDPQGVAAVSGHAIAGTTIGVGVLALFEEPPAATIEWASPGAIAYGTVLGSGQLNATADAEGSFTYTPAAGTRLHAGAGQTLTVTFTPNDPASYGPASATVPIDVTRVPLNIRADDKTRATGAANPAFTATYQGFVSGEGPAALNGTLSFATSATSGSPAGTYPITPSGLSSPDYAIAFVPGVLTVTGSSPTPPPNGPNGYMTGNGHIGDAKKHQHFVFRVWQIGKRDFGRFEYWMSDGRSCLKHGHHYDRDRRRNGEHDGDYGHVHASGTNHFEATSVTNVAFSDLKPKGRGSAWWQPAVDTVVFSGAGKWNGKSGYTFEARATDAGEPGRGRDTFSLVVRDRNGKVVATSADTIDGGNVDSLKVWW